MKTRLRITGWVWLMLALTACPGPPPLVVPDAGSEGVAPRVLRTEPAHQSTGASVMATFLVQFSEPMNTAVVTVTVSPATSLGVGTWNARKDTITFPNPSPLQFGTAYTLDVSGQDVAGNELTFGGATFFTEMRPEPDAGPGDAGPGDAGPGDAGPGDAGPGDAGVDAGVPDAGSAAGWDVMTWDVGNWQ